MYACMLHVLIACTKAAFGADSKSPVTLMTLVGSVPAVVAGEQYEIPVTVWLTDNFPEKAPPVYVTPNPGT